MIGGHSPAGRHDRSRAFASAAMRAAAARASRRQVHEGARTLRADIRPCGACAASNANQRRRGGEEGRARLARTPASRGGPHEDALDLPARAPEGGRRGAAAPTQRQRGQRGVAVARVEGHLGADPGRQRHPLVRVVSSTSARTRPALAPPNTSTCQRWPACMTSCRVFSISGRRHRSLSSASACSTGIGYSNSGRTRPWPPALDGEVGGRAGRRTRTVDVGVVVGEIALTKALAGPPSPAVADHQELALDLDRHRASPLDGRPAPDRTALP